MIGGAFRRGNVIAGQGTAALELLDQAGPLDVAIAPVGGGGLVAGTALEAEIIDATRFVWERLKIVIEPSSAVVVAPLLADRLRAKGRVGVILSGGNVEVETFFEGLAAQWL